MKKERKKRKMKQEIFLLNRIPKTFTNKETGEVNEMVLITYGIYMDDEKCKGYAPLECYCKAESIEIIDKYLCRKVNAEINITPLNNGFKYSLVSLNNERIR